MRSQYESSLRELRNELKKEQESRRLKEKEALNIQKEREEWLIREKEMQKELNEVGFVWLIYY